MTSLAPKWFPEKIRDWLTWPKADGGGKSSPPDTIPQYSPKETPASGGARPGDGRRPRSEKPKPGTADDVGASLEALHAAQAALKVERAAQAKRVAALALCEHGLKQERVQDLADIQRAIDDAIKRFEELQKQLKEEVGKQLNQIAKFNEDYNKAWNKGMDGIDKYLHTYLQLLPGLKNLFDAFVDRNTALEMGHAIDEKIHQAIGAVMAVEGAAGLVRGVAKWAAEEGAVEGAEILGGAAARKGAVEGAEGVAEAVGGRGALEGGEGAAGAAGREGVAAGVEGDAEAGLASKGAQKGALEGEGTPTVKGGGEGRPPEWETQKLGPDGKPIEPEGKPTAAEEPPAKNIAKDETVGPKREPVGEKTDIERRPPDEVMRQEAAQRALDKDWRRRYYDAMEDAKVREEAWFEAQDDPRIQPGESIQEARERILRETAFAHTGRSPVMDLGKMEGAERQLEVLSSGREYLGVKPTPENISKVYEQYMEGVNGARRGVELFPDDYLRSVGVDDAAKLGKAISNETQLSYWLDKLKAAKP